MDITDEMVTAYRRAEAHAESAPGEPLINDVMRAGLAAVAPLIAAQALRSAAASLSTGTYHRECSIAVVGQLEQLAESCECGNGP